MVAVVTQPDRPAGRGQHLTPPPVKQRVQDLGIPIVQPPRLRDAGWPERLAAFGAEVGVVVAFGQILPQVILDVPSRGSINVHASLLPRYRGAAPIAWALIRGETETGITTFQMDAGMDTGAVLLQERTAIGGDETAGELAQRLSHLGARVLLQTLENLDAITPSPQDGSLATLAPRLKKEDGWLSLSGTARDLTNRIRGCNPWPGAALMAPTGRLVIWRARALAHPAAAEPGLLVPAETGVIAVATGSGLLLPHLVQPDNRKAMAWEDFLRGARLGPGTRLAEIGG